MFSSQYATPSYYGKSTSQSYPEQSRDASMYLRELINQCMVIDSLMTGEISQSGFSTICERLGLSERSEVYQELLRAAGSSGYGLIRYFALADRIAGRSTPKPTYQQTTFQAYNATPRSEISIPDPTSCQRKTAYESSIVFGDDSEHIKMPSRTYYGSSAGSAHNNSGSAGANVRFSAPSSADAVEMAGKKSMLGLPLPVIMAQISSSITDQIGSTQKAYNKWRGMKTNLSAEDIREGLIRDCGIVVNINDIYQIMQPFGNPLTLGGFVSMIGSCGDATAAAAQMNSRRSGGSGSGGRMTEDDQTISDLAVQLRNSTEWVNAVMRSRSTEDILTYFSRIGVAVDEDKLRRLVGKVGRTGLIDAIEIKNRGL